MAWSEPFARSPNILERVQPRQVQQSVEVLWGRICSLRVDRNGGSLKPGLGRAAADSLPINAVDALHAEAAFVSRPSDIDPGVLV